MTLRLGIVGCGFIAALHSRALRALARGGVADATVVAACDLDLGRAVATARAWGAEIATADPAEVLEAVDAVWICTPTSSHRALVESAAEAGVAVFCEKPLATTLVDAEAMAAVVAERRVANRVGLVLRTAPAYVALAELLASGALGTPMAVVLSDDQYLPVQGQYASTWRGDVAFAGGGTLLEHSIHDLDVLRWLLGEAVVVSSVTAAHAGLVGIEDVAVATLTFASGAVASLTSVWHQVLTRPSTRSLEVLCQHGIASVGHEFAGPLQITTDAGVEVRACPPPGWVAELPLDERWRAAVGPYVPQAASFLDVVAGGSGDGCDLAVAVAAHRLADAAYRSAGTGGTPVAVAPGALPSPMLGAKMPG